MRLQRTFSDYFDYAFDGQGAVFRRVGGNAGPSKPVQFQLLEKCGFATPPHGYVGDVMESWWPAEGRWIDWVVAYTDVMAHCSEGKRLFHKSHLKSNPHMGMPGGDRYWQERHLYCSAFVGDPLAKPAVHWRRLQIGHKVFWVEYCGNTNWQSNFGDVDCEVIGVETSPYFPRLRAPLFAVDFVLGKQNMYAVDLNFAPGIRHSGVEKYLSPEAAVAEIEGWFEEFGDGPTSCAGYTETWG